MRKTVRKGGGMQHIGKLASDLLKRLEKKQAARAKAKKKGAKPHA